MPKGFHFVTDFVEDDKIEMNHCLFGMEEEFELAALLVEFVNIDKDCKQEFHMFVVEE